MAWAGDFIGPPVVGNIGVFLKSRRAAFQVLVDKVEPMSGSVKAAWVWREIQSSV
jgi:hypothetical protein